MLGKLEHRACQQLKRPAGAALRRTGAGGRHQQGFDLKPWRKDMWCIPQVSSLPVILRSAPGRGSSLSARSRLPSTKRRLVRYTVEPLTPTLLAISSSLAPPSAARKICARLSLRDACLPPLSTALSSVR